MCQSQHDLTEPLPVQAEQLYHNINTWRTGCKIMLERYGPECDSLKVTDLLQRIEKTCAKLGTHAIALYQEVIANPTCWQPHVTDTLTALHPYNMVDSLRDAQS